LENPLEILQSIDIRGALRDTSRFKFLGISLAGFAMGHSNLEASLQALGDFGQTESADLRLDRTGLNLRSELRIIRSEAEDEPRLRLVERR